MFGRNQAKVDVPLLHESISREHAIILLDSSKGAQLVDLGGSYGTKLDSKRITDNLGIELKTGSEIRFGASSRVYKVHVDYRQMQKSL